jgi:hypothetical protein
MQPHDKGISQLRIPEKDEIIRRTEGRRRVIDFANQQRKTV